MIITKRFTPADSSLCKAHLTSVVGVLNDALADFAIISHATADQVPDSTKRKLNANPFIDGLVFEQQIKTFGAILKAMLRKDVVAARRSRPGWSYVPQPIALTSLTQAGKTSLINLGAFLSPIIYLLTGERAILQRLLTNHLDLEQQSDDSGKIFSDLYQNIVLSHFEQKISVWEYYDYMKSELKINELPVVGNGYRTSRSLMPHLRSSRQLYLDYGVHQISFCDESDARSDENSILSQIISGGEYADNLDSSAFLGLSATNDAFRHYCKIKGYSTIDMLPGGVQWDSDKSIPKTQAAYTGYPWQSGKKLKNIIVPEVMSFSKLDFELGTNISNVSPMSVLNYDRWARLPGNHNKTRAVWDVERDQWIMEFVDVIRELLLTNNPLNAKGVIARLIVNNEIMTNFKNSLEKAMPQVKVVLHIQNDDNGAFTSQTLVRQIDDKCGDMDNRVPYLLLVTGKGRRGTVAPKDCRYGMDFAVKSCPNTLKQGIAGRLTGYGKGITWVILSNYNSEILKHHIQTGRWEILKKSGDLKRISPYPRHVGSSEARSIAFAGAQINESMRTKIEQRIRKIAEVVPFGNGHKVKRTDTGCCFPWKLLEQIVREIEDDEERMIISNDPLSIIRPGKKYNGDELIMNDGLVSVAVRFFESGDITVRKNHGSITDRDSQGGSRLQPVLVIDQKYHLMTIKFRLASVLENNSLKPKSMLHKFIEQDTNEDA